MHASQNRAVEDVEVDKINYLNILLMGISVAAAVHLPFETFLFAYAVLGPLHYATEISWLHDRGFFTLSGGDWRALAGATVVASLPTFFPNDIAGIAAIFALGFIFIAAAGMAFSRAGRGRAPAVIGGIILGALAVGWWPAFAVVSILIPTLIHVYVFTGLFILYGAVKGRSFSGILSLLVFLAAPVLCLYWFDTPAAYAPSEHIRAAVEPFHELKMIMVNLLGLRSDENGAAAFMRLMGFAYTYHYLNWFSKTRIINWHQMSRRRLGIIGIVYAAAVGTYAIDFRLGFTVLFSLSLAHVVLEFPLNFRTIGGLASEGMRWIPRRT